MVSLKSTIVLVTQTCIVDFLKILTRENTSSLRLLYQSL